MSFLPYLPGCVAMLSGGAAAGRSAPGECPTGAAVREHGRRPWLGLGPRPPEGVARTEGQDRAPGSTRTLYERGFSRISYVSITSSVWMSLNDPSPMPH